MRTVEDAAGRRYLLEKRSAGSSRVRDLETGETRYVPDDELTPVEGADPLVAAARAIPDARGRLPQGVHDERALGLLVLLRQGPRSVRALLDGTALCESDLLGTVSELRAAGLVAEATVDGERGYGLTDEAREALASGQSETASREETGD